MNTSRIALLLSTTALLFTLGCSSVTKTHFQSGPQTSANDMQFLIIGGGGTPSHNQVSLEKNVLYLKRLLKETDHNTRTHTLFADGNEGHRVVQTWDEERKVPELNLMLSEILGSQKDLHHQYRSHALGKVDGTSNPKAIEDYFNEAKKTPQDPAGRLLYFTGHGGSGTSSNKQNTSMYLWGDQRYRVDTFCEELDKLHTDTPVTLLMVQCYSGGFANVIFKDGNPKQGLSPHARCGFYSTVHDRTAAGCTPDINEASYKEYSNYFLEALWGTSRMGESVQQPDYDNDDRTSFDEAHAYALIKSTTIDISVKTSDTFLRHYSKLGEKGLDVDDYTTLLKHAHVIDQQVLRALSTRLGLTGNDRVLKARKQAVKFDKEREKLKKKNKALHSKQHHARTHIRAHLQTQCPELANPWHPDLPQLLKRHGDEMLSVVEECNQFKTLTKLNGQHNQNEGKLLELNRDRAVLMRFVRTAESVALEANLSAHADSAVQDRYIALKALEHRTPRPNDQPLGL
jgi:hypothetical protein